MRAILPILLSFLLLGCPPSGPSVGGDHEEAPDFVSPTLDGGEFTLSEHEGQIVLLNFWATWCAPCVVEIPHLVQIQDEYRDEGVIVVGVSQDTGPDVEDEIRSFANRLDVNYPLLLDGVFEVATLYGVDRLPTTVLVDRNGIVLDRKVGLLSHQDLVRMVGAALEEENP